MSIKIGFVTLVAATLAGCASIAVTDDVITQRTSTALGIQPSQFTISNRSDSGVRTDYQVTTTRGKHYSCYVTGMISQMGRTVSDAICTQMGAGSSKQGNTANSKSAKDCNTLLRAAGRCD